jgi:hypothetical protein
MAPYGVIETPWGNTDAGGNSVGELIFIRTYSRVKADGTKETWPEVCRRVIEGMYSIQKDWCKSNRLPWNDRKAQASAQEAFDRMFNLKWTPPGRGLWVTGTEAVHERGLTAALYNCSFISTDDMTRNDPGAIFGWVADALMCGIGVGFDTRGENKNITIRKPEGEVQTYVIPDSREGWAESVRLLVNSLLRTDGRPQEFDYSLIRPAGAPIRGFGGTSSGMEPLYKLHEDLRRVIGGRVGERFDSRAIVDTVNLIGTCVVAGNVRRSATIALGSTADTYFIDLKSEEVFPERNHFKTGWGWMSNNTLSLDKDSVPNYEDAAERILNNGEPGFMWLDTSQEYGRMVDPPNYKDSRAKGTNPCAEITLESYELCNLVEIHLNNIDDAEDLQRTLKFAYLYAKSITLLPTHWPETNAVIQRNRRIGTSMTGISQFSDIHGLTTLREWFNEGYDYVQILDKKYSEWLGIRESIKTTTVKPSGTVSLLSGASPGVHWTPGGEYFLRAVRFSKDEPIVHALEGAGYTVEDDLVSANTKVAYFPIHSDNKRSEREVTIFEKIALASETQRYWADNSVSVTVSFDPETEGKHIATVLKMYEGKLKTVSFLPMGGVYKQQPYTQITQEQYESYIGKLQRVDHSLLYANGKEAEGDKYCTTDVCEIPGLGSVDEMVESDIILV